MGVGGVFDDLAALHDKRHGVHYRDVGEGVAFDGDDVGVVAGFDGAELVVFAEHGGGVDGGCLERAEVGEAAGDECAELAGDRFVNVVVIDAVDDFDVVGEGEAEGGALSGDDFLALGEGVRVAALGEAGFHVVLEAIEGGNEPCAVLLHEGGPLFVEHGAVLDGVDAGADSGLDADGSLGVGHDLFAGAVGDFDGLGHLLFTEFEDVVVGDGVHDAAGGHEFDPVGAVLDVAADDACDVIDGVGDVGFVGDVEVGREGESVAVATGEGDAGAGCGDAGPEDEAALDGVSEGELGVV